MPPKTGLKSNISLSQKASSRPYVIVAIHISDPTLKWLKKDFAESLKKHKRKAVVGILFDDVVKQIEESRRLAQEAAEKAMSNKGISLKGSPSTKGSAFLDPAELLYQEVQKRIIDLLSVCVKDDILEAKAKINIIDIWDNLKGNDKSSLGKGGKITKPFQNDTHQCLMRPTDVHALKESRLDVNRKMFLKIQNLIIDHPENVGITTYVFLLGEFDVKFYMKLMAENYPLKYICFFHAKGFPINPDELNDIDMLKYSERTKNRGIIEQTVVPISWCLAQKYSENIYKELSFYSYDLLTLESKYKDYLENFIEISVDEIKPVTRLIEPTMLNKNYPLFAPDELILPIYLNLLFDNVCGESIPKNKIDLINPYGNEENSCQTLTPKLVTFTENNFDYLCVENSNLLLKLMICSRISTDDYEIVSKYWRMVAKCNRINIDQKMKCKSVAQSNFNENIFTYYVELYSDQSFSQKLIKLRNDFKQFITEFDDRTKLTYFSGFDERLIFNNKNIFFPTKLCYRDFILYLNPFEDDNDDIATEQEIWPEIVKEPSEIKMHNEFIRLNSLKGKNMPPQQKSRMDSYLIKPLTFEDIAMKNKKTYYGYNLGDVQKQIDIEEIIYQSSTDCSISFRRENWIKDFIVGQLNISIFGQKICCNKNVAKPRNIARITTKNYSTITINFQCISDKQVVADLAVSWPNGLFIKMKYNWENERIDDLQQSYIGTSHSEENRIFNLDGSLIKIYKSGDILLFCSNGNIYETKKKTDTKIVKNKSVGIDFQYIEKYANILDELNFSIIKANGNINKAYNGQLHENCVRKLLLTEYHDYATNEILATREDGIKFIWSSNEFKFYYPDGTLITTELIDNELFESTFEDNWKSKLKIRSSLLNESEIITNSIIEELIDITQQDNFILCSCKYKIEHENFSTFEFGPNFYKVISPDTIVEYSEQEIQIKIESNTLLTFTKNNMIIKSLDENQDFLLNVHPSLLNFPFMQLYENNKLNFTIDQDGKWIINHRKCSMTSFNENCSNLLIMKNNNEGCEIVNKMVKETYKESRDGKTILVLESLNPFDKIYRMSNHKEFLNKFEKLYKCTIEPTAKLLTFRFMYMTEIDCKTGILKYPNLNITPSKLQNIIQNTIQKKEKSLSRKADKGDKCFYILHYCGLKREQDRVLDLILTKSFPKYFDVHTL